ncbi:MULTISPECIES: PP2C family protein-serine/threonine phosphatase [Streptomyces]|uniref:Serine/threonine-protein phosphatase n=1 Tax=Streptomyces cadmiisoli TaxID=2184053 RepID=A0A2Z4ITW4_9ACTN|nr:MULTISPECIES: PP2C family protein-serine/threonine phosphatase [Streptomyces]AWW36541.1 serine/threonine-protein phosphatase [Streptomyces cadmiisoli]
MSTATTAISPAGFVRAFRRVPPSVAWLAGPLLLIVAVPVADAFLPPDIHLAHLLTVATAVAAFGSGPRATTLVGSAALLSLTVAGLERHTLTTESVLVEWCSLAAVSVLLILFTHLRDRHERALLRALSVSDTAQRVVLRPLPERAGPVRLASEYRSADADAHVGGDLYASARTTGSTRLIIGDVRGKGLASISDTAIVLGAFRAAAHREIPLPELVSYVEDAVRWGLAEFSKSEADLHERFVTAVIVDIPDDEPVVHLVSCGHPPPLLVRRSTGTVTTLQVAEPAPPLGLAVGESSAGMYVPATFPFRDGDRLILYTDGVTEARDPAGRFYPLAERVAVRAGHEPGPLVEAITADLRDHAGGRLRDDMAVVVAQRDPGPVVVAQRDPGPVGG